MVEVIKLESRMSFYFRITKSGIIMTQEDEDFENNIICRFCEKKLILIKLEVIVT